MVRTSPCSEDEGADDQANKDDNFQTGQPKLKFAEKADAEVVDTDDDNQENSYPNPGIDLLARTPVLYYQRSSGKLIRGDNDVFEPVAIGTRSTRLAII